MLVNQFPEHILNIWFKDNKEKRAKFGKYLLNIEEINSEDSLYGIDNDITYEDKLNKILDKEPKDLNHLLLNMKKYHKMKRKYDKMKDKARLGKKYDLSIASFLNGDRFKKKYISNDNYRKELKKIAKAEKAEIAEMRKLGYIKNLDVDKELEKIKNADKNMKMALSDSYIQKHFVS